MLLDTIIRHNICSK